MSQASRHTNSGGMPLDPKLVKHLSREEFGRRFSDARRKLWWVAASVLGRREQVDDVLQEAAVIALGKLDEFDPSTSFEAWMAQVVRYVALNAARKRVRHEGHRSHIAGDPSAPVPVGKLDLRRDGSVPEGQSEFDDRVVRALQTLPDIARSCLLLRSVEGLSYREIAQLLSLPEGTAMSHVHRARISMRKALEEGGER